MFGTIIRSLAPMVRDSLLILLPALVIPQQAVAAIPPVQQINKVEKTIFLSLDQLNRQLKIFSIRVICWSPADNNTFVKVSKPSSLNREQWFKVITETFSNKMFVKEGGETIVYLLPAGISSNRVSAVTSYSPDKIDPFIEFDKKNLMPLKSAAELPEIVLLKNIDKEEKKSGLYYERFVKTADGVSAYTFRVEEAPHLQAMTPISEKTSTQQQELTGFLSFGGVLEFIQSQSDNHWLQMRSQSGYLYLTSAEANAPLFTIQQSNGQETIAMRSIMPNGTPFSYTIVKTGNSFTSNTNLVSNNIPITLLDFATLGGKQ